MAKLYWLILVGTLAIFGLIIFWPHLSYPFPFHVDEWHHLTEARRLTDPVSYLHWLQAEPGRATSGLEIGFQFLLLLISKFANPTLIYKFLPALWAMLSGLTLFFVAYRKSAGNFLLAWLSLVFFMSIRTNSNLTGLWFFTPLSFSFPFIFLYTYFVSEGILIKNKKYLLGGFLIMLGLIFFHPLSVLFSVPIFFLFFIINYRQVLNERTLWFSSLIIFCAGLTFFAIIFGLNLYDSVRKLLEMICFSRGWGVLELNNSPFELYSWLAWFWAIIGIGALFFNHKIRNYSFYVIWPGLLLVSTVLYRVSGLSFFSPFQRNLYYLALVLPLLSGYGLFFFIQDLLPAWLRNWPNRELAAKLIGTTLIIVTFFIIFVGYYQLPTRSSLYRVISRDDYETIKFLADQTPTVVMGTPFFSTALVAMTQHEVVGAINFYGQREPVKQFYTTSNCQEKQRIIQLARVGFIYWPKAIKQPNCPWLEITRESRGSYLFIPK